MHKKILLCNAVLATTLLTPALPAMAAWPDDRPIELIVGFAPGGGTDVMARLIAQHMEKRLGDKARIIVVNKPGAGGEIAVRHAIHAKPDGYTLTMINAPGFTFLPMYKGAQYKTDDIRLIARLVDDPLLFVKRRGSAAPDHLKGIVEALRQKPESLSFGHSGDGTTGHLALMDLERHTNVKSTSVPFKGGSAVRLGVLGDHIDYGLITVTEVPGLDDPQGSFIAITQTMRERGKQQAIPTAAEQGYKVFFSSERGIGGPKALPDDIVKRLQDALDATLKDPAFLKASGKDAEILAYLRGEQWKNVLDAQAKTFEALKDKFAQ